MPSILRGSGKMKLAILSDIHTDINYDENDSIEKALVSNLKCISPELFIIAGDVSNNYLKTLDFLNRVQNESGVKTLFVPGNHDLWNIENPDKNTDYIYDQLKSFKGNICDKPYDIDSEWTVIGDVMWYDYSFAHNRFKFEDLETGKFAERNWKDKEYIDWGMRDVRVNEHFIDKIHSQIDAKKDRKIIFVSHMLTHPYFTVKNNELWEYFNGYLGSDKPHKMFEKRINVKYSIMGHVHYRKEFFENGTKYICSCLNYRTEWYNDNASDEIRTAINVIDI